MGEERTKGKDAQSMNILSAKMVAEVVRTTLGPKGMDKMLVDEAGNVTVTNDGVTILEMMEIENPTAKMIVEIAKTQEKEVGDGTTTAVVLAGQLLKESQDLLEQDVHPTIIARGFRLATTKALELLEGLARNSEGMLEKVAMTAMTGKGAEANKEFLAKLVVNAATKVASDNKVSLEDVKIETQAGSSVEKSELIEGIVLDKEKTHSSMPEKAKNAKIALLNCPVEVKRTETEAKISIDNPEKLQQFLDMEEDLLEDLADKIEKSGADVVFCQKGIDDVAAHHLAKNDILAVRRVSKTDMERLAKATGARIISNLKDLDDEHLGKGSVEQKEGMVYVRDCRNAKSVTILLRGGTEHVISEMKRALEDAMGDVVAAITSGKVVSGAGSTEMELSKELNDYADKLSGREQLAVQAFAKALEIIPRTLAENAGLDPIDALTNLRAAHDKGNKHEGINVFTGNIMNAWEEGVIEPLKIKTQAVSSASEVAVMILRIDDVIYSEKELPPQGAEKFL